MSRVEEPQTNAHTIVGGRRPIRSFEDIEAVVRDAHAGQPAAMRLLALTLAAGLLGASDWRSAVNWMAAAAEAGDDEARGELVMLAPDSDIRSELSRLAGLGEAFPSGSWLQLARSVDLDALLTPPPERLVSEAPLMAVADDVSTLAVNRWLIARARPHLERARVVAPGSGQPVIHDTRSNSMVEFRFSSTGLPLLALRERLARMVRMPAHHFEASNLLHYTPGQRYRPHFDSLEPGAMARDSRHAGLGQRVVTVLVYLNDDYAGGETCFPMLDFKFKGRSGCALFWRNTQDGQSEIDPLTLHEGLPPTRGEKWLLSHWVRERPVPIYD